MEAIHWIASPYLAAWVVPLCGMGGLSLCVAAWLFFWQRRQMQQLRREFSERWQEIEPLNELPKRLSALAARIEELDGRTVPPVASAPALESVHLNRRGQVLKLHRSGYGVHQIASSLGVSRGEVQLTLKLHGLIRASSSEKQDESSLISERIRDRNTRGLLVKGAG